MTTLEKVFGKQKIFNGSRDLIITCSKRFFDWYKDLGNKKLKKNSKPAMTKYQKYLKTKPKECEPNNEIPGTFKINELYSSETLLLSNLGSGFQNSVAI